MVNSQNYDNQLVKLCQRMTDFLEMHANNHRYLNPATTTPSSPKSPHHVFTHLVTGLPDSLHDWELRRLTVGIAVVLERACEYIILLVFRN